MPSPRQRLCANIAWVLLLAAVIVGCSRNDDASMIIAENWGAPVGYTVIRGAVTSRTGVVPPRSWVDIGNCRPQVWAGEAQTDAYNTFSITSHLPAIGELPMVGILTTRPDTLHVACSVMVNRDGVVRDSIDIHFGPSAANPTQYYLSITIP